MSEVLAVLALALATAFPQTKPDEAQIDKLMRDAREGSLVVRPQAAARLLKLGAPAAERLRKECAEGTPKMAALGADLIEILGQLGDDRLRTCAWQALGDADFPWRPAAARGLAAKPLPAEAPAFEKLLADPLGAVRVPALSALDRLEAKDATARVRELLQDPDDRVRREAARVLDRRGEHGALAWPLEDLARDDHFFELPTGKTARFEAARLLEQILGERLGLEPGKPPTDPANAAALAALREKLVKRAGGSLPELPAVARANHDANEAVLGLEVRSCRHGEFFLRWTAGDELLIGLGNPRRVKLEPGTTAKIAALARGAFAELAGKRVYGQPGCDLEQYHWQPDPGSKVELCALMKTPALTTVTRPPPLAPLALLLVQSAPADLQSALRAALASVGGNLDT